MTVRPDFGPDQGDEEWRRQAAPPPTPDDDIGEREVEEREIEDREPEYLDAEDNEAHAPGQICARCGQVITTSQDVRRLPDGRWMHEVCPPDLSGMAPWDDPKQPGETGSADS
jgi:hypothetical protein